MSPLRHVSQRKEKKRRKMLNDPTGGGTPVVLYRINQAPYGPRNLTLSDLVHDLSTTTLFNQWPHHHPIAQMPNKQKLYKIDTNAQQNHLTGLMLLTDECNLIIVEGGPKAQVGLFCCCCRGRPLLSLLFHTWHAT